MDASAAILALLSKGESRRYLGREEVHVPHLADTEIAHVLRRQEIRGHLPRAAAAHALAVWSRLALRRHPVRGLSTRVWELRFNCSAYDAAYVALAEALGCSLVTADQRLVRASGLRCPTLSVNA